MGVVMPTTDDTEQGDAGSVAITEPIDQVAVMSCTATAAMEATSVAMPNSTEQGEVVNRTILGATDKRMSETYAEEAKSEDDDPLNQNDDLVDFKVFDSNNFMEWLRKERLFNPIAKDDVNAVLTVDINDEDVMEDNVVAPDLVEVVDMNDYDPDTGLFDLTCDDLRNIAASGWIMYEDEQSGTLQLEAEADYYDGQCGPTRSAVAYADSPFGIYCYFLPKELWIRISEGTNRYRGQNVTTIAISRRNKLLTLQAKDPMPNLSDIEEDVNKFNPIQAYEIVHVVALLFARDVAPV
ncbi:hypothetical protein PHPALM_30919 [Phytophthora palmivora]|uniref:Uncharacterized protein n=1 Tax=Phytophthora palmivora TaxID=4796 RepID=A0A2P4X3Y8_9STRA|nr:hypothetical protein PHPALM_30919 [Phytophthora palmivora]